MRTQARQLFVQSRPRPFGWSFSLESAMHKAKKEPENQHHIAVAGPPAASGEDQEAGTEETSAHRSTTWNHESTRPEPKTPIMEIA